MANCIKAENQSENEENKAQNLVPKGMHRLHGGGHHVLDELAGLPRQIVLRHEFIVAKAKLVPYGCRLYNQGDLGCFKRERNRWPCACITRNRGDCPGWPRAHERGGMEERLKSLMQDLGNAINESLSDSERIAEAIGEIKRAGYDVFLVLEATIGFNKRDEDAPDEALTEEPQEIGTAGRVRFTTQDQRFLKALRITVDEEV